MAPPRRADLDIGVLREMYVVQGLSLAEVGMRVGAAGSVVARHLRRAGIAVRPPGGRLDLPVEEIAARFRAGESQRSLARAYGVALDTIKARLKSHAAGHADQSDKPVTGRG
ncbi:hypothetical protein ACQEU5_04460 [Marinactinospora thermotolerans]|nr:hypothetical protein [Marinactinospora thermotolerans]